MNKQIPKHKIIEILNVLNLKFKDSNGKWIKCQCPFPGHNDNRPSAGVNIHTGVFNCFGCHESKHIINVVMDSFNCDFKSAIKMLEIDADSSEMPMSYNLNKNDDTTQENEQNLKSERNFSSMPIDLSKYLYTKSRGFTKEFCDEFNIELALSGLYKDYIIIPIHSNNVETFEARKVMEHEYNIMKDEERIGDDEYEYYKNKPKTLYPKNSYIKRTLWNYGNLDFDKILYLVEGLGSIPKIYLNISKNVTCTFGSQVSKEQLLLLKKFKKIIVIPDNDTAGLLFTAKLNDNIFNLCVKDILYEDTDEEYVNEILNTKEILSSSYLVRKTFKSPKN
ncbi:MAG: hypothetical protein GY853_09745 [PVC group bacterium]|nr:hypothetical protein [PVC group bacterium]